MKGNLHSCVSMNHSTLKYVMIFITEYLLNELLQEHANMLMDSTMKEKLYQQHLWKHIPQ